MRAKVDIDCTPEEARRFLGLPDVRPMQETLMKEMETRLMHALRAMDAESLMKTWMPVGIAGMEQWQKLFWQAFNDKSAKKNER